MPEAGRHLDPRVRNLCLPPSGRLRAAALIAGTEEKQSLRSYRRHVRPVRDWRGKKDKPFDLGMLIRDAQSFPAVIRPSRNACHPVFPNWHEFDVAAGRLARIGVCRRQEQDASHDRGA